MIEIRRADRSTVPFTAPSGGDPASVGVVIRLGLVSVHPGRAAGTFAMVGPIAGAGTVNASKWLVTVAPGDPDRAHVAGELVLAARSGELVIALSAIVHAVPRTAVSTGGGTWTLVAAGDAFDGLRAAGAVSLVVDDQPDGSARLSVVMTGRIVARETPVRGV